MPARSSSVAPAGVDIFREGSIKPEIIIPIYFLVTGGMTVLTIGLIQIIDRPHGFGGPVAITLGLALTLSGVSYGLYKCLLLHRYLNYQKRIKISIPDDLHSRRSSKQSISSSDKASRVSSFCISELNIEGLAHRTRGVSIMDQSGERMSVGDDDEDNYRSNSDDDDDDDDGDDDDDDKIETFGRSRKGSKEEAGKRLSLKGSMEMKEMLKKGEEQKRVSEWVGNEKKMSLEERQEMKRKEVSDGGKGKEGRGKGKEEEAQWRDDEVMEAEEEEAKEPEAEEPEAEEPEAEEPETEEPEAKEPEAKEPEAEEPDAKEVE